MVIELPMISGPTFTFRARISRTRLGSSSKTMCRAPWTSASRRSSASVLYVKCLILGSVSRQHTDGDRAQESGSEDGHHGDVVVAANKISQPRHEVREP